MKKRILSPVRILLLTIAFFIIAFLAGPRVRIDTSIQPINLPNEADALEKYIVQQEARFSDITPKTKKHIIWYAADKKKTDLALVYIHGFGATRQETAPVPYKLARKLEANLFETRLSGHGRGLALGDAKAHQWIQDTEEAYQIGRRIGKKVIFLSMSTGSPLTIIIAQHHKCQDIAGLALLSPNFSPKDKSASMLLWPWGLQLARFAQGDYFQWEPYNEEMGIYWTTRHKIDVLLQMMALVEYAQSMDLSQINVPLIIAYTRHDDVIDPEKIRQEFPQFGSTKKKLVDLAGATKHNIASAILSPQTVDPLVNILTDFFNQ